MSSFATYARSLLLTLLLILGGALALNVAVDPLWHFQGNRITGINIGFNERVSKLNQARRVVSTKNCVIYGSSRGTLLDGAFFAKSDCFNMAVSEGLAPEFPLYARALKSFGLKAGVVVINADDLSFFNPPERSNAPVWLVRDSRAPEWWQDYVSLDALQFSFRALAGKSPTPRYYRDDFSIAIEEGRRVYLPVNTDLVSLDMLPSEHDRSQGRTAYPAFIDSYRALIAEHPAANVVVYIPPISIWRLAGMIRRGELSAYLDSIHSLSALGAPVLDFSVPSVLTTDATATYDGSHFSLASNRQVAALIETPPEAGDCEICLRVDSLSHTEYRQRFRAAYQNWRQRLLAN